MVNSLQRVSGRDPVLRRRRRSWSGGEGAGRAVDLSIPSRTHPQPGHERPELRQSWCAPCRKAGEYVQTPVPARTECPVFARRKMGSFSQQYVRKNVHIRSGSLETAMSFKEIISTILLNS